MLTNGTSANVKIIPNTIPPIKLVKFCCHGSVPIPNSEPPINNNLINATCVFLTCFQCISINKTIDDATTPANDGSGPT